MPIVRKTLSFVKGKGSLSHNNRTFVADNVDSKRIDWNITYVKETLEEAYEKCFGEAIREYNAGQKRKDRLKHDYINEIKNSRNNEKVFYENVVMIGCKKDTGVVDENGHLTHEAAVAAKILDHYVKTFQERNPNLYLFNAVLHMDEATPHLHLDYIPVAKGCYKKGLKVRNSLSKAFQCMGFEKGKGKYENETTAWQSREREYISELCAEHGIEIEVLGEERPSLSLPEYKQAIQEVEELEDIIEDLKVEHSELQSQNEEYQAIFSDLEAKIERQYDQSRRLELDQETKKAVKTEVDAKVKHAKSQAVNTTKGLFQTEAYVKVPKTLWDQMLQAYKWGLTSSASVKKLEERITTLEKSITEWKTFKTKVIAFLKDHNLVEAFQEYLKPQSVHKKIDAFKQKVRSDRQTEKTVVKEKKAKQVEGR
ncbi:MAG: plasmid recombination protein [Eubacteriales bacterium]|nr:plasmid recombination protein [Eubacteriales bacterium]